VILVLDGFFGVGGENLGDDDGLRGGVLELVDPTSLGVAGGADLDSAGFAVRETLRLQGGASVWWENKIAQTSFSET